MTKGKYFFVKSRMNGMVLGIKDDKCEAGSHVVTCEKKDGVPDNQLWRVDHVTDTIRSKANSKMCIAIDGDNTLVIDEYAEGNDNQKWKPEGDCVKNTINSKVLDIAGENKDPGARVCSWEGHGGENQQFETVHLPTKYFYIKSALNGKVLDVKGGQKEPGAEAIMYDQGEAQDNQMWYENEFGVICSKLNDCALVAPDGDNNGLTLQPYSMDDAKLWTFCGEKVLNQKNPDRVFDIAEGNTENGAKVIPYSAHGGENQKWKMEFVD